MAKAIKMPFAGHTDMVVMGPRNYLLYGGSYGSNVANTIEWQKNDGDVGCCCHYCCNLLPGMNRWHCSECWLVVLFSWAGQSRSATVVLAYVMKHLELSLTEALDLVRCQCPAVR